MTFSIFRLVPLAAGILLAACGAGSSSDSPAQSRMAQPRAERKTTTADYANEVQQLYVAYFGRPADPNGLNNFENQLLQLNAPTNVVDLAAAYKTNPAIQTLIDSFGLSKESQTLYAGTSTQQFVTSIFNNVLGRQPQSAGLNFWISAIDSGSTSQGNAALSIMAGAYGNTAAQQDVTLINNRLAVAADFTSSVWSMNATSGYVGANAAASARQLLSTVTASTTPSALLQQITSVVQSMLASTTPSDAGNYCGTISGDYSGTVQLTLTAGGNGIYNVTGTASVAGETIPISGQTQPPALGVELVCTTGVCGSVTGTVSATSISGSWSLDGIASGNIALSRSCP